MNDVYAPGLPIADVCRVMGAPKLGRPPVPPGKHKWTDVQILEVLDLQADGYSTSRIAKAMAVHWKIKFSKNQIIGLTSRIRKDRGVCVCVKPANKDGGMPDRWWTK